MSAFRPASELRSTFGVTIDDVDGTAERERRRERQRTISWDDATPEVREAAYAAREILQRDEQDTVDPWKAARAAERAAAKKAAAGIQRPRHAGPSERLPPRRRKS